MSAGDVCSKGIVGCTGLLGVLEGPGSPIPISGLTVTSDGVGEGALGVLSTTLAAESPAGPFPLLLNNQLKKSVVLVSMNVIQSPT